MRHGLVGRDTLAELLLDSNQAFTADALAQLLGFDHEPDKSEASSVEGQESEASKVTVKETQQIEGSESRQIQRPRPVGFWRAESFQLRVDASQETDNPAIVQGPGVRDDEPKLLSRRPFQPLAKVADVLSRLRRSSELAESGSEPDIDRLVDEVSQGRLPVHIPLLMKRIWGASLFVIQDVSDRLLPYHADIGMLSRWLRERATTNSEFALFDDKTTDWPTSSPQKRDGRDGLPASTTTVLPLTDLGVLNEDTDASIRHWYRLGKRLARNGNRLVALVTCRSDAVPKKLADLWHVVPWERLAQNDAGRPTKPETEAAVSRLLALVSLADSIEPQLIRIVRRMLPEGRRDSGLESRVWQKLITCNADEAIIDPESRASLIASRQQEMRKLQRQAFDEVQRIHAAYRGLRYTEVLNLGDEAEQFVSPTMRQQAEQWFSLIGERGQENPSLKRFFRIAARQLSEPAMDRYPMLHDLWQRVCGISPDATPPIGFDSAMAQSDGPIETVAVSHVVDQLNFQSHQELDLSSSQFGSPLGFLRRRSGHVSVKQLDDSRESFWESGVAPRWASEWGIDKSGMWCSFRIHREGVGTVIQRMRWLLPGRYEMGSPETENGRYADEGPPHEEIISSGFWMFDTPCTQALWESVMGNNPSEFKGSLRTVENVSWDDCQEFITKLNGELPGLVLELPSEACWEYGCRAGTQTPIWNSTTQYDDANHAKHLDEIAWYDANRDNKTHDVGQKLPNPWGLYDMLGNVDEWCSDNWCDDYGSERTSASRVVRGGNWGYAARSVRAAYRVLFDPSDRSRNLGFRCSSSGEGEEPERSGR